jgi:hypothetical protein
MGMYNVTKDTFAQTTLDLDKRAVSAINQVWNYIASDYLELCPRNQCSHSEMLEGVMDASRLEDQPDKEAAQYVIWMSRHKPTAWKRFCKENFSKTYC